MKRKLAVALVLIGVLVALRLFSFRFPSDIRTVLEPWRSKLSSATGSGSFDSVAAQMADRDRALEDHLNLISQGRLAYATSDSAVDVTTGNETDLPDLSVTVTLPANRVVRVSGQVFEYMEESTSGTIRLFEDGNLIGVIGAGITQNLSANSTITVVQSGSFILTPDAGEHTYKLTGRNTGTDLYRVGGSSVIQSFILVEDIGPAGVGS